MAGSFAFATKARPSAGTDEAAGGAEEGGARPPTEEGVGRIFSVTGPAAGRSTNR
jgi:hypothetical protein